MYRRILSWALIVLGGAFLILSVIGVGAIWVYRGPLTDRSVAKLEEIDSQLMQAKSALDNGQDELQRTLRIVDAANQSLSAMKVQMSTAKGLSDQLNSVLNDKLMPGLKVTRDQVDQLRGTLQGLRESLGKLNSIPLLNLNLPGDQFLADIIGGVDSLDKEIADVQALAQKASTTMGDTSYLLGGDLTDTKVRLQKLLDTVTEYDKRVGVWHSLVQGLIASVPGWLNEAAVILTLLLLWFGFSQFGLVLHGLALRQGADPLAPLRHLRVTRDYDAVVD